MLGGGSRKPGVITTYAILYDAIKDSDSILVQGSKKLRQLKLRRRLSLGKLKNRILDHTETGLLNDAQEQLVISLRLGHIHSLPFIDLRKLMFNKAVTVQVEAVLETFERQHANEDKREVRNSIA